MSAMQESMPPRQQPRRRATLHAVHDVDEVVVERIVTYLRPCPANPAERLAVIAQWTALGRPVNDLERLTGWNVRRILREVARGES